MNKKIVIISFLDGFANSYKPLEIKRYLEARGHSVTIIDTQYISRFILNKKSFLFYLPSYKILAFLLYFFEAVSFIQKRYLVFTRKYTYYYFLMAQINLRSKILYEKLKSTHYDLLICESQFDSGLLSQNLSMIKLYDCATPWADELFFGGDITKSHYKKFKKFELGIYETVDYLSFHWESYAEYIKKYYPYQKNNLIKLNKGCSPKDKVAIFNKNPRIIYLGYLGGYWINLPLLSKLSKMYAIDVYGSPKPDEKYGLNYKGYANPRILADYQFGLITLSKDILRKHGFSAKHLDYISYGLPTLVPEWRENLDIIKGTIPFNEENFLSKIKYYSKKSNWENISNEALKQSKVLNWDSVLKPLDAILKNRTYRL